MKKWLNEFDWESVIACMACLVLAIVGYIVICFAIAISIMSFGGCDVPRDGDCPDGRCPTYNEFRYHGMDE